MFIETEDELTNSDNWKSTPLLSFPSEQEGTSSVAEAYHCVLLKTYINLQNVFLDAFQ